MSEHRRGKHTAPVQTNRERDLADLLRRTLASYRYTVEAHDGCPSCGTDWTILVDKAAALGVVMFGSFAPATEVPAERSDTASILTAEDYG